MIGFIEAALRERRSLKRALADLLAKQERAPSAELARMIGQLQAEIAERKQARLRLTRISKAKGS